MRADIQKALEDYKKAALEFDKAMAALDKKARNWFLGFGFTVAVCVGFLVFGGK